MGSFQYNMALAARAPQQAPESLASWTVHTVAAGEDTLREELQRLFQAEVEALREAEDVLRRLEYGGGDSLYRWCEQTVRDTEAYAPYHRYAMCMISAAEGDTADLELALALTRDLRCFSMHLLRLWPGRGDHLQAGLRTALLAGPATHEEEAWAFLECALEMDLHIFRALSAAASGYLPDSSRPVEDGLRVMSAQLGGPLAACAAGSRQLLAPGGMLGRMDSMLTGWEGPSADRRAVLRLRAGLLSGACCLAATVEGDSRPVDLYESAMAPVVEEMLAMEGRDRAERSLRDAVSRQERFMARLPDPGLGIATRQECRRRIDWLLDSLDTPVPSASM